MLCPKCNQQNPEGASFCTNCGNPLTTQLAQPVQSVVPTPISQSQVAYVPSSSGSSIKLFAIIGGIILLLIIFGGGALVLSSKLRQNLSVSTNESTNTAASPVTSSESSCQKVYNDLLAKYGEDYNSCLTNANADASACQKPGGLTGDFKQNLNIIIILDDSGSMAETVSGGQKITIAKNVITNFVNSLPASAKVGLMVYGNHGSNSNSDQAVSCAGIDMVYPLSTLDKNSFISAVNSFQPTGWTPIAGALNKAQTIFAPYDPATNSNLIYLVTDGLETCNGNPVAAAQQLNQSNAKAIVNIVGFNVDNTAQAQLQQAAQAGGGKYYSANSADEINKVFNDQNKLIGQIADYRNCVISNTANQRNTIISAVADQRNCLITKAADQRNNIINALSNMRNSTSLDPECASKLIDIISTNNGNFIDKVSKESAEQINNEAFKDNQIIDNVINQSSQQINSIQR